MSIAMVFPGQGSQSQGMQADLAAADVAQVKTRAAAWMAEASIFRAVGR